MAQFASKKARVDGYFPVVTKDPAAPHGSLIAAIAAASAGATTDGAAGGDDDNVEDAGDDDAMGDAGGAGIAGGGDDNVGSAGGGGDADVGVASDDDDDVGGGGGGANEGTPMPVNDLEEEDEAEEEGATEGSLVLTLGQYGENTPPKAPQTRRRTSLVPKGAWVHIKRIKDGTLRAAARVLDETRKGPRGDTHVCILCWARLSLTQDKSRESAFMTTVALAHLRDVHPHLNEASKSQSGMDDKQLKTVASMLAVGMSPGKGTLGAFYVSPASRALSLASRYYVYGRYKSHSSIFNLAGVLAGALAAEAGCSIRIRFVL
jgi:hypothetical protein